MPSLFFRRKIIPEVLRAYQWRLPESLDVNLKKSEDGGYVAIVDNLPGCITQAETGQELFGMVNDAALTYLQIPEEYHPYLRPYLPPEGVREELKIKIPEKYLREGVRLVKT